MIDTSVFQGKTAAYFTLGCKLNFSETSTFGRMLQDMGVRNAAEGEKADICLINTCSVTEVADHKCRQAINRMVRQHPGAFVVVTGCYAQLEAETISKIDGVDLVLGANEKASLIQYLSDAWTQLQSDSETAANGESLHRHYSVKTKDIKTFAPSCSRGNRTRFFLKVQDGCDYFCTYCTIPFARGHSRSVPADTIIGQANELAAKGIKEIVLTGVNIGDYGKRGETLSFLQLLKRLNSVKGIERYRISSIEPNLLTDEIIDWIASGTKFQPHFHIPLQSGCDSTLSRMKRKYTTAVFKEKINYIREKMGDVFFGIDVIVGFPGESDEEFEQTYRLLAEEVRPAFIHIFPYSRRTGTIADKMPGQIKESVKSERVKRLEDLCGKLHNEYIARFKGTKQEVLFESTVKGGKIAGYTGNYIRMEQPFSKELIGKIVTVEMNR